MNRLFLIAAVTSMASACGPGMDNFSCNSTDAFRCTTIAISGGTFTDKTCNAPFTMIASCATTGLVGRCTINGGAGLVTCPADATCTVTRSFYTGADVAAAQADCTSNNGTWAAN